ncbi:MAG: glycosyltransferase family 39 protein, partial [Candidatus Promineifilaceae bacterium]|nr:glycosyltransferase family 39 protein [Candidatus Promineifilaceae bacterium]
SSYTGKEVLFFYLAGGIMRALGDSVSSLRLTAAYVGLLTIAATYWLGREMLADRRLAILAAALLAVSFWHVLFSRLGFRAITQPLLQALTIAALFRGLRREENRWILLGGVFLGLTAYTYLAARIFPMLLILGLFPLLLDRKTIHRRWRQLALFALTAFVFLIPLLVYFVTHPDAFWVRIGQVAPGSSSSSMSLQASFIKSLSMIFLQGDPFWRFNLPGRPLFGWLTGGLLMVGWFVILLRWRKFPYDWQRAAISLLVFTPLVMILPTALATNEIVPSNLRAIGLIPLIFFLPPIGFIFLIRDIERRLGYPPLTFAVLFGGLLILFSGGIATEKTYFKDWAKDRTLFFESDGDLTAVADFIDKSDLTGKTLFVAAPHYRHPTLAFLSDEYENIHWLPNGEALVFPANSDALVIYPHNVPAPAWAVPYLNVGRKLDTIYGEGGDAVLEAFQINEPPLINENIGANFGDKINLLGYETGNTEAGSDLPITLFWRVEMPPEVQFSPFLQLEDRWGNRWSQEETFSYPSEQWQTGDLIIQHIDLPVPPGAPPGKYRLRVGLFDPAAGSRLPVLGQNGTFAGDSYFIEEFVITPGEVPDSLPDPAHRLDREILPGLQLVGYSRGDYSTSTGSPWGLALWWTAEEPLPPMTAVFELVDSAGNSHTLHAGQPVFDTYPFTDWVTPQFIIDHQILNIPLDLPPGEYQLRLQILAADGAGYDQIDLGPLGVESTDRIFDPPPLGHELDVEFGSEIRLLGYDWLPQEPNQFELVLVWQARQATMTDYTAFIHILNQDGTCCVWQIDAMPKSNQYPTSRWLPGEIVIDAYEIAPPPDLAAGDYPMEVGLYLAETGQRLAIKKEGQDVGDALQLQPLSIP